jgi:hypothetical protein
VAYVYLGKGIASGLSGYLDRAFFNAYYDGATAVGDMFAQAKTDYLSNIPFGGDYDDLTVMEYNLLGDPTVGLPAMPMTSKAYASADVSNQSIRVWVETYEENATIDLYYRRSFVFGGRWNLLGSSDEAPHEWTFMPEQDGAYEFHSVLRSGNYTENAPKVADATCFFDFSVPSVAVVKPERGAAYLFNSKLAPLRRNATVVIGAIDVTVEGDATKVEFYVNGNLMHTAYEVPFVWTWHTFSLGRRTLTAVAYNELGTKAEESLDLLTLIL